MELQQQLTSPSDEPEGPPPSVTQGRPRRGKLSFSEEEASYREYNESGNGSSSSPPVRGRARKRTILGAASFDVQETASALASTVFQTMLDSSAGTVLKNVTDLVFDEELNAGCDWSYRAGTKDEERERLIREHMRERELSFIAARKGDVKTLVNMLKHEDKIKSLHHDGVSAWHELHFRGFMGETPLHNAFLRASTDNNWEMCKQLINKFPHKAHTEFISDDHDDIHALSSLLASKEVCALIANEALLIQDAPISRSTSAHASSADMYSGFQRKRNATRLLSTKHRIRQVSKMVRAVNVASRKSGYEVSPASSTVSAAQLNKDAMMAMKASRSSERQWLCSGCWHHRTMESNLNPPGLFTGENLLHIAIVSRNKEMVNFLLEHDGISDQQKKTMLTARAHGLFFMPPRFHAFVGSDADESKTHEVRNVRSRAYFGEYPYHFACCMNEPEIMDLIWNKAKQLQITNSDFDIRTMSVTIRTYDNANLDRLFDELQRFGNESLAQSIINQLRKQKKATITGPKDQARVIFRSLREAMSGEPNIEIDKNFEDSDDTNASPEPEAARYDPRPHPCDVRYIPKKTRRYPVLGTTETINIAFCQDCFGNTALHMAVHSGSILSVDKILDVHCTSSNASLSKEARSLLRTLNGQALTPFTLAVKKGDVKMYEHLRKRMSTTIWVHGDSALRQHPLEQFDSWKEHAHGILDASIESNLLLDSTETLRSFLRRLQLSKFEDQLRDECIRQMNAAPSADTKFSELRVRLVVDHREESGIVVAGNIYLLGDAVKKELQDGKTTLSSIKRALTDGVCTKGTFMYLQTSVRTESVKIDRGQQASLIVSAKGQATTMNGLGRELLAVDLLAVRTEVLDSIIIKSVDKKALAIALSAQETKLTKFLQRFSGSFGLSYVCLRLIRDTIVAKKHLSVSEQIRTTDAHVTDSVPHIIGGKHVEIALRAETKQQMADQGITIQEVADALRDDKRPLRLHVSSSSSMEFATFKSRTGVTVDVVERSEPNLTEAHIIGIAGDLILSDLDFLDHDDWHKVGLDRYLRHKLKSIVSCLARACYPRLASSLRP